MPEEPTPEEPASRADSIQRARRAGLRRATPAGERPAHPALAATLLMLGVLLLLVLIAAQPLLGR